jgi:outer membrane beta-barrel protein
VRDALRYSHYYSPFRDDVYVEGKKENAMKRETSLLGVVAFGALAVHSIPAAAQAKANTQEVHIYAGELFGDDLTDRTISGTRPRLDDTGTFGARYAYNLTDVWGVELSAGYSPSHVSRLGGGNVDLGLTTVDVDAVWNFTPRSLIVGYTVAGVGFANANLDRPIRGVVNGQAVSLDDENGFTANAGIGAKYYATDNLVFRVEGRYRYLNSAVSNFDRSMNTVETTLGVGWRF